MVMRAGVYTVGAASFVSGCVFRVLQSVVRCCFSTREFCCEGEGFPRALRWEKTANEHNTCTSLHQNLKLSVLESQYYLAPASTLCLFSVAMVFEFPGILASGAYVEVAYHPVLFFLSGFMGIVVNFASFWLIQVRFYISHLTSSAFLTLSHADSARLVVVA